MMNRLEQTGLMGWLLILLTALPTLLVAETRPRVLVIESYHASNPWDADYTRALRDRLSEVAELHFFAMDTKRLPAYVHGERAELAWQVFKSLEPDMVLLGDDNALMLLGERFGETGVPVIFLGINNNPRNYFTPLPLNMSGVLERPLLKRSIVYMNNFMGGELDKVLVLFDNGITAKTLLEESFEGKGQRAIGQVDVHIKLIDTLEQWREMITSAPAQGFDAVVVGLYHTLTTADGRHVPDREVITWSSENTQVPLFAFWQFAVGKDLTIGGLVLDGYVQGELAAEIALDVLQGKALPRLPLSSGEGRFVFSRTQLDKWGIELPAPIAENSTILP